MTSWYEEALQQGTLTYVVGQYSLVTDLPITTNNTIDDSFCYQAGTKQKGYGSCIQSVSL